MTDGRVCGVAAMVVAALIVYASLVPFDLNTLEPLKLLVALDRIPFAPWRQVSGSDVLVNVAVGLALGFFLTGAWRSAFGYGRVTAALALLGVACVSSVLAAGVEALQAFSPTRDSSWNDVLAQTVGAIVGSLTWAVSGRTVVQWMRRFFDERELSTRAIRLLYLYLPIYLVLQLTSVDAVRVAKLATKYAGGGVTSVPSASQLESSFLVVRDWIGNGLLNAPIGTLAAIGWLRQGQRRRPGWAFLLGVAMAGSVSVTQVLAGLGAIHVGSIIAATIGVGVGIAVTTGFPSPWRDMPGDRLRVVRVCGVLAMAAWLVLLIGQAWHPFDFQLTSDIVNRRLTRASLVPFVFYYGYASYVLSPLQAVHEGLLHFLMAVPLGLLPRLAWGTSREPQNRQLQRLAITLAATTSLIGIELGQMFLPTRFPDVTDVLIGTIGVIAGEFMGRSFAPRWQSVGDGIQVEAASSTRGFGSAQAAGQIPNASANDTQRPRERAAVKRSTARS
jgi:VanZ family protein